VARVPERPDAADPSDGASGGVVGAARGVRGPRELLVHLAAAVLGPIVAVALLGGANADLVWRTASLAAALTLVVRGMQRALTLGREEWHRNAPPLRSYGWVAARFGVAFVLVVVATS
jgi:type IV secretory pathway TrbD component